MILQKESSAKDWIYPGMWAALSGVAFAGALTPEVVKYQIQMLTILYALLTAMICYELVRSNMIVEQTVGTIGRGSE